MDPQVVREATLALGRELAARRKAAGFSSQKAFAPFTGYSRSTVANVETGRQRVTADFWNRCDEVLQTGGLLSAAHADINRKLARIRAEKQRAEQHRRMALLSEVRAEEVPAQQEQTEPTPTPETAVGATHEQPPSQMMTGSPMTIVDVRPTLEPDGPEGADSMERRSFLAASLTAPFAAVLPHEQQAYVTADEVARIHEVLPDLYRLDAQLGGDGVVQLAASWLQRVDDLLNKANYAETTGRQLQILFGELAQETGWLHFDAGRQQHARFYYGEALRAAQLSEDLNLEVMTLAAMNMLARYQGRPREGIQLAQFAQRRAAGWAPPRMRALLAVREAECWAQLGDDTAYRSALLRAEHVFDPAIRVDDPAWLAFFDTGEMAAIRATAEAYLGRHDQAAAHMEIAVENVRSTYVRNTASYRVHLGLMQLAKGDETAASEAVRPALPLLATVRSGRINSRFNRFSAKLGNSKSPAARELFDQIRQRQLPGASASPPPAPRPV